MSKEDSKFRKLRLGFVNDSEIGELVRELKVTDLVTFVSKS